MASMKRERLEGSGSAKMPKVSKVQPTCARKRTGVVRSLSRARDHGRSINPDQCHHGCRRRKPEISVLERVYPESVYPFTRLPAYPSPVEIRFWRKNTILLVSEDQENAAPQPCTAVVQFAQLPVLQNAAHQHLSEDSATFDQRSRDPRIPFTASICPD
ncbi:hypothetical protein BU26DRAFT_550873 [Trematosphaeria pertusa]|uniref:Uncharacterized protein n=1 Tax=Trematosphaeria pertusa TaxID=390896 RepID=A0A6A6IFQ0_9PLEO|nr:uncharacterized protein BU26DRAFT_550873 [Trematosphaeria pertusa]KAF2249019.1 hypothetical protein BU26DRAFT_550873 [Trematosphaeria pertusa]